MANQDAGYIQCNLDLGMWAHAGSSVESGSMIMDMELGMTAVGQIPNVAEPITMDMDLLMSVDNNFLQNSGYIVIPGFLDMYVNAEAYCMGEVYDFVPQRFLINMCEDMEDEMIERYEGDTYPFEVVFSLNGNHDITGYTFEMFTQIGEGTVYSSVGTITNETNGFVSFSFVNDAINTVGEGTYEIKANTPAIVTFAAGEFIILDSIT